MNFDLIVCRSLAYAQRTSVVLEREGISSIVLRAPAQLSDKGCGYAVKIPHKRLTDALSALNGANLPPNRVFNALGNGRYREVSL